MSKVKQKKQRSPAISRTTRFVETSRSSALRPEHSLPHGQISLLTQRRNDAAPLRRRVSKLIWPRGRECRGRGADNRDVSTNLVVREIAGERRFLRLTFDIDRHREPHLTSVRRRSIRDLSRSQRTRDRSGDALSFLLQRQTDRAVALARVDYDSPRTS